MVSRGSFPFHVLHGVQGVQDEVEHHLLQMNAVAVDRRERRVELEHGARPAKQEVAVHQSEDVADQIVQVERP